MQRGRVNTSLDGRVVRESLRLARELSRPRSDPLLHLVAASCWLCARAAAAAEVARL